MRRPPILLACLVTALAACTSGDDPVVDSAAATTTTAAPGAPATAAATTAPATSTSPTTAGATNLTLTVTNLRLVNSEESDNALRVLFASGAPDVTVTLGSGVPSPNQVIRVCPTAELDRRVPGAQCATPASGEAVRVPHGTMYRGVEVVQVGVAGSGPAANATTIGTITVTFSGTSREIRVRMPPLVQGESGGRPTFRLSPVGPGAYRASATWNPSGGVAGEAELALLSGTTTVTRAQGAPGVEISGTLSPPAEASIALRNSGSSTLLAPALTMLFP
jgi:hypothetical protein